MTTNNIDRAAEVIRRVDGDHTLGAGALAEALADAGLLAPDLDSDLSHTVVEQAETIKTLSRLLSGAEEAAIERAEQIKRLQRAVNYSVIHSLQDAFDLVVDGVLHPEDMEAPE